MLQPAPSRNSRDLSYKLYTANDRSGGRVNGASPAYSVEEMSNALKTAKTKFLMTVPNSLGIAIASAQNAGIPQEHVFLLEGEHEGFTSMKELLEIGKSYGPDAQTPAYKIPKGKKNKDICGFLNFSSGTTGLPKAVMLSHQAVIAQCIQLKQITVGGPKKVLACLPLFHSTYSPSSQSPL
jgi:4-coumarate--CoA ligase